MVCSLGVCADADHVKKNKNKYLDYNNSYRGNKLILSWAKSPPFHVITWTRFCCSLSAAHCCKVFQHKYFGFTPDTPRGFCKCESDDLHNVILQLFFKADIHSVEHLHTQRNRSNMKRKLAAAILSINTNISMQYLIHTSCRCRSAKLWSCASEPDELQWLSSVCPAEEFCPATEAAGRSKWFTVCQAAWSQRNIRSEPSHVHCDRCR